VLSSWVLLCCLLSLPVLVRSELYHSVQWCQLVLSRLSDETTGVCFQGQKTTRSVKMKEKSESYATSPWNGNDVQTFFFLFSATATGICGLGEFPVEEAANNKAGPRPETGSSRWSHSCFAHWDCRSVMPYGTIFHLAVLDLV